MSKTLYYDLNKHQLTIGDCASGALESVRVEPTLSSDTFQISEYGHLQIKIGDRYSDLIGPSLIGPSGKDAEKGITIKGTFEPGFDSSFPTNEVNDAYIITRDAIERDFEVGQIKGEFPSKAKKGDLYVCHDSDQGPVYTKVCNLAGPSGDSPQIEIRHSVDADNITFRNLYVNGTELTDANGEGVGLLTDDDVKDLYALIQAAQEPATTSLDDPLTDLNAVVQQQAQQIEELQASLIEATARIAALEADTAWLKELNKDEMLQYWGVKTTTEE